MVMDSDLLHSNKFYSWYLAFTKKVKEGQLSCCFQPLIKNKWINKSGGKRKTGERETGFLIDVGTSGVHLHQAKASDPVSRDWAGLPIQVTPSFPSYYLFLNVQWKRATSKSCCKSNTAGETQLLGSSTYSQAMYSPWYQSWQLLGWEMPWGKEIQVKMRHTETPEFWGRKAVLGEPGVGNFTVKRNMELLQAIRGRKSDWCTCVNKCISGH